MNSKYDRRYYLFLSNYSILLSPSSSHTGYYIVPKFKTNIYQLTTPPIKSLKYNNSTESLYSLPLINE